jgi:hypothetical protein
MHQCVEDYLLSLAVLRIRISFYADPDLTYHFDTVPDPDFYLMRMRFLRCGRYVAMQFIRHE